MIVVSLLIRSSRRVGIKPMLRRLAILILIGICLSLTAACRQSEEAAVPEKKAVPVEFIEIKERDLPVVVEAVGRLAANRDVVLSAEVGGVVAGYRADVGDPVETDQVLVEIDPVDYQLALGETRANLAAAQAQLGATATTFKRFKNLLPRGVVSADAFEKTQAEYKAAKAAVVRAKALVDIAEERLDKTRITAPFKGHVAARQVEEGQALAPGQPVMNVVDLSAIRVKFNLAERDYVHLDQNDLVTVMIDALPDKEFKGRVDRIGIKADPMTNTFAIEVLVDNPDLTLKAGLTARLRLTLYVIPHTILIPQSAVLYRENRKEVYVINDKNQAERRELELGQNEDALIQVLSGLKPGDRLVISGGQYLKPGDNITLPAPQPAEAQ